MFGIKYTAMQIAKLEQELKTLPNGYLGKSGQCKVVRLYADGNNREEHRLTSKIGRQLGNAINRRIEIEKEIEALSKQYDREELSKYIDAAKRLQQPFDSGSVFNNKFFNMTKANQNTLEYKNNYVNNGIRYRSKNEVIVAQVIEELGLPFKVEPIVSYNNGDRYFPDFIICFPAADRCVYLEIFGKFDDFEYAEKNYRKIRDYLRHGLEQNKDIIFLFCSGNSMVDAKVIRETIIAVAETICPDIL